MKITKPANVIYCSKCSKTKFTVLVSSDLITTKTWSKAKNIAREYSDSVVSDTTEDILETALAYVCSL